MVASPAPAATAPPNPAEKPRLVPTSVVASAPSVEPIAAPAPVTSKVAVGKAPVASKVTVASKATTAAAASVAAVAKAALQAPASTTSSLVSLQTASVDELAKVKGLNLKIANEIIKARPFASLEDLIRVPGIGEKTLEALKRLLTI